MEELRISSPEILVCMQKLHDGLELDHKEATILSDWLFMYSTLVKANLPEEVPCIEMCEKYIKGYGL